MLLIQFANLIGIKDRLIQLLINYDNYLYCHENKGTRIFPRYTFSPSFSRYTFSPSFSRYTFSPLFVSKTGKLLNVSSLQSLIEHFNLNFSECLKSSHLVSIKDCFHWVMYLYSLSHVSFPHPTITAHISFTITHHLLFITN